MIIMFCGQVLFSVQSHSLKMVLECCFNCQKDFHRIYIGFCVCSSTNGIVCGLHAFVHVGFSFLIVPLAATGPSAMVYWRPFIEDIREISSSLENWMDIFPNKLTSVWSTSVSVPQLEWETILFNMLFVDCFFGSALAMRYVYLYTLLLLSFWLSCANIIRTGDATRPYCYN